MHTRTLLGLMLIGLIASPAAAQWLCDDPDNLSVNCGFDTNIDGWLQWTGDPFTPNTDGNYAPGSIDIDADCPMGCQATISQCINGVPTDVPAVSGLWVKIVSGMPLSCYVDVTEYVAADCQTYNTAHGASIDLFPEEWNAISLAFTIDVDTSSMAIQVGCSNFMSDDFVVRYDDIFLLPGGSVPIFADGFEHNSVARWSSSQP